MPTLPRVAHAISVLALLGTTLALGQTSASAAVTCAPDAFEPDNASTFFPTAARVPVGGTLTRSICQERNPPPREMAAIDYDYFTFSAPGGTAYSIDVPSAGSALADSFNVGGLVRFEADGSQTTVPSDMVPGFRGFRTPTLSAGLYGFLAYSSANQVYPGNLLDMATISGESGVYTVRVSEAAPVPVVASLTLNPTRVKAGKTATGTYTLSGPAPAGGMYLFTESTSRLTANPSSPFAAAGTTRGTFTITTTTQKLRSDIPVTISLRASTGPQLSVVLTVQK